MPQLISSTLCSALFNLPFRVYYLLGQTLLQRFALDLGLAIAFLEDIRSFKLRRNECQKSV